MLYSLSKLIAFCFFRLWFKLEISGKEVLSVSKSFILASNHLSNLDPPLLAVICPYKIGFLAKEELFKQKLSAFWLKDVGAIPLKRGETNIKIMRQALKILKTKPLLIFPQGTRDVGFEQAKAGVGFLYRKSGLPIIAAKIYGTDKILPRGKKFPGKGKIKVIFSKVDNIYAEDSYANITLEVVNKIKNL